MLLWERLLLVVILGNAVAVAIYLTVLSDWMWPAQP